MLFLVIFVKTKYFIMTTNSQTNKVTAGKVVSATREYSNVNDSDRKFNISVEANIQNGKATGFNSGNVTRKDSTAYGNANFNAGENLHYFSFNSNGLTGAEVNEAMEEVITFMENVKKLVENSNNEE